MKSYEMNEMLEISKKGTIDIINYLKKIPETIGIINVEDDLIHQYKDIDRIWIIETEGVLYRVPIEIKVDRYYHTGNYFFETVSNMNTNSNGCFNYTKADYLFYYFPVARELHIMDIKKVREWFMDNKQRFKTSYTSTKSNDTTLYTSTGKLVSRSIAIAETKAIKVVNI